MEAQILAKGESHPYFEGTAHVNLRRFWTEHKTSLPLHYAVYVAEVGCITSAAANVENVFFRRRHAC